MKNSIRNDLPPPSDATRIQIKEESFSDEIALTNDNKEEKITKPKTVINKKNDTIIHENLFKPNSSNSNSINTNTNEKPIKHENIAITNNKNNLSNNYNLSELIIPKKIVKSKLAKAVENMETINMKSNMKKFHENIQKSHQKSNNLELNIIPSINKKNNEQNKNLIQEM